MWWVGGGGGGEGGGGGKQVVQDDIACHRVSTSVDKTKVESQKRKTKTNEGCACGWVRLSNSIRSRSSRVFAARFELCIF